MGQQQQQKETPPDSPIPRSRVLTAEDNTIPKLSSSDIKKRRKKKNRKITPGIELQPLDRQNSFNKKEPLPNKIISSSNNKNNNNKKSKTLVTEMDPTTTTTTNTTRALNSAASSNVSVSG